jgi:hypothetical protein
MAEGHVPPSEQGAYHRRLQRTEAAGAADFIAGDDPAAILFIRDFQAIAHALTDELQRRNLRPHEDPIFPPFRVNAAARRLPFGPLRRIARRIGLAQLHYIFEVGSDKAMNPFRLLVRPRLDKEFSRGNRYKRHDQRAGKIDFGNRVLEIERGNVGRTEALERAGGECGLKVSSTRSFERYFHEFRAICMELGYVPHPLEALGHPPVFALSDLDGRSSDTAQK